MGVAQGRQSGWQRRKKSRIFNQFPATILNLNNSFTTRGDGITTFGIVPNATKFLDSSDTKPPANHTMDEKTKSCLNKKYFSTRSAAKRQRKKWLRIYKCRFCDGYHFLSANKRRKTIKTKRERLGYKPG